MTKIAIIGAGAWGTALASTAAHAGNEVTLVSIEKDVVDVINTAHENKIRLPHVILPKSIKATLRYNALKNANFVMLAPPAQVTREVCKKIKPLINDNTYVIICSKGIELSTHMLLSEVLLQELPNQPFAVLSGPAFAQPLAMGLPSACTLASPSLTAGRWLASTLSYKNFRLYPTEDVIGVQLGGSLKNVIAIAVGIADGMGLSENTRAMTITRGLHEIARFGTALGAKPETFMGLSGMGDLILTCSPSSRNYSLGFAIGKGKKISQLLKDASTTREGVYTARAAYEISKKKDIDAPLVQAMCDILDERFSVEEAVEKLLSRPLRPEERC